MYLYLSLFVSVKRSISIRRVEGGVLQVDGGTLYVTFMEHEANVSTISEKVKHDLGSEGEIVLCDDCHRRHWHNRYAILDITSFSNIV